MDIGHHGEYVEFVVRMLSAGEIVRPRKLRERRLTSSSLFHAGIFNLVLLFFKTTVEFNSSPFFAIPITSFE
jgi:hypothetical protein